MAYDFTGLTPSQQRLMTFQGWARGDLWPKPSARVVQPLIDRGLVVVQSHPSGDTRFDAYAVPIPVHMAWCHHCAANEEQVALLRAELKAPA